jgi:hypothetical protein
MPDINVKKADGKIAVSHPTVQVSVSGGDKVTWQSDDGHFRIRFDNGDWDPPETKNVGGKHVAECGPFHTPGRTLKYTVAADGHPDLDPEIEIRP